MNGRILIIEDEEHIARVLELELGHEGYSTQTAYNGRSGADMALSESWDLILLDIMLPELNGLEVLRRIRQANANVPVILLTARGTTPDIVSGFGQGANDYVTKPFAIEELLARIRNLLAITKVVPRDDGILIAADLKVEPKTRKVSRAETAIELTPTEYDLLLYLIQHKSQVLSREQIISDVWGYDFVGDTNIVDVYIRYLRQKIDKGRTPKLIQTARGVGYYIEDSSGAKI
ncbi:response regulator transcription factor [Paenibacillus thalictri]|uniref:Response regulator transcription factor n=1 Tax=Paenibacillus thalictri TaxID=2527873 RepID=A0A4Q9DVJ9_9BACL|nr:response regulator transcription factor [Paenibacillus thalictri]TBL80385.1 response regulator transcription factor [Paenibacillus thalictri]